MEIAKIYDPKQVEDKWYQQWQEKNYFAAKPDSAKKPFTIVIPPPNVTAILHMGHAFNNTIQDIYIRYKRKQGFETLWQPGTDHAGIATQNVVEKSLAAEGLTRHDLGREKFVEKVWEWREKYGSTIIHQLKKMGCSCDWSRERFTMDEGLSNAVKEVFVRLYEKGLIYQGKYIINWCPRCATALSDEEVEHEETNGNLWYFRYPIKGENNYLTVATTRPETMLGDTAVAINPKNEKTKHLLGKTIVLPLMDREIPVIADDFVDPEFGTGCVKVTPAHDPNDFQMGQRHNLEQINLLNPHGTLNDNAGRFSGLDRFEARKQVIAAMDELGLLEKTETHTNSIGHCHRCHTIVEPYLSEQWFVKVEPLAKPALDVVQNGKIKLHPSERWFKTYEHWMENVRDWCISRQLWWGHRIPVFYCDDCGEMMVLRETPLACTKCRSKNIRQDEDVLDTWFSSWLWPFSTLGWPEKTDYLKYFYPTDMLVTGPDIIFFWVARMIMAGLEFMGDVPFTNVLLNGIVRDEQGKKMSKSLGNGIDPLEMIDEHSADAVRFTLLMLSSEGQDINLSRQNFEMGRNFSNKIWNAYRFLAMNLETIDTDYKKHEDSFELADRWILSRFHQAAKNSSANLDKYRVNDALNDVYHFFWHDYCDWYLELIKKRLYDTENQKARNTALSIASFIMKETMSLLHPFMPFISEEIWQALKSGSDESIVISDWPQAEEAFIDTDIDRQMAIMQDAIGAIRNARSEMDVPPSKRAPLFVRAEENTAALFDTYGDYFISLARVESIHRYSPELENEATVTAVVHNIELFIPLADLIDVTKERERLQKEIDRFRGMIKGVEAKLNNENFVSRAPEQVVQKEREKLQANKENLDKLLTSLKKLD